MHTQKLVLEPPFFHQCLIFLVRMLSVHVKESKTVWIRRRGFRITGTGFRISIVSGIPDSLSCIPDFRSPIFWNPQAKISRIPAVFRIPQANSFWVRPDWN